MVDVSVHFNDSHEIGKKEREEVASAIVKLVSMHLPDAESSYWLNALVRSVTR